MKMCNVRTQKTKTPR